ASAGFCGQACLWAASSIPFNRFAPCIRMPEVGGVLLMQTHLPIKWFAAVAAGVVVILGVVANMIKIQDYFGFSPVTWVVIGLSVFLGSILAMMAELHYAVIGLQSSVTRLEEPKDLSLKPS